MFNLQKIEHKERGFELIFESPETPKTPKEMNLFGKKYQYNLETSDPCFQEKHQMFIKWVNAGYETIYISKSLDNCYYDLIAVVKDEIPIAVPVPIVNQMIGLPEDSSQIYNYLLIFNSYYQDYQAFSIISGEEYERRFATFYQVRDL